MKTRRVIFVLIVIFAVFITAQWWLPWILELLKVSGDLIQSLDSLINIASGVVIAFTALASYILIKHNRSESLVTIKGNVYLPDGKSATKAKIVVVGLKGDYSADSNGYFEIPVQAQREWTITVEHGDFGINKIVTSKDVESPLNLKLRKSVRKKLVRSNESTKGNNLPYIDLSRESQNPPQTLDLILVLQEWKLIHTGVQKLLFSTTAIERQIIKLNLQEPQIIEVSMKDIELHWVSTCEPKSKDLRKTLGSLCLVEKDILNDLRIKLDNKNSQYISRLIRDVDIYNVETFDNMQLSFFELVEILKEVLNLADMVILQTATDLNHNFGVKENLS